MFRLHQIDVIRLRVSEIQELKISVAVAIHCNGKHLWPRSRTYVKYFCHVWEARLQYVVCGRVVLLLRIVFTLRDDTQ